MYSDNYLTRGLVSFDEVNFGDEVGFDEFEKRSFLISFNVFEDVINYFNTQFFYERDKLLYHWLIQTFCDIIDAPPARGSNFSCAKELDILFGVLLPKIKQIEHEAKRRASS